MIRKEIEKLPNMEVPSTIGIEKLRGGLGFVFNNNHQVIQHSIHGGYSVKPHNESKLIDNEKLKLVPIMKRYLEVGDIAFRYPNDNFDVYNINYYCIKLDAEKYLYVNKTGEVRLGHLDWEYWFKLEVIKRK